ncbi:Protein disulfide isomerase-like 2-1, partial [Durusdinium trenchii]
VQLPLFNLGQAYALTIQYGYVLKRAENRLQLERTLQDTPGASLKNYIKNIGPGMFQDAMISVEAHVASKMQVEAVFGNLKVLRGHLANALAKRKPSREGTGQALQDAVNCGEVAGVYIFVSDVRRANVKLNHP